jgi:hypothetical protein
LQPNCRRAVAFIVAALHAEEPGQVLVDLASNEVHAFEGDVAPTRIAIVDCTDGGYFTGSQADGQLSIHDHRSRQFFTLEMDGERFGGFDYCTSTYYSGQMQAGVIHIHDEHSAGVFSFSIQPSTSTVRA